MTESEWLAGSDPRPMLEFLQGKASDRKLLLFAIACTERVVHLLPEAEARQLLRLAERAADGEATDDEVYAGHAKARGYAKAYVQHARAGESRLAGAAKVAWGIQGALLPSQDGWGAAWHNASYAAMDGDSNGAPGPERLHQANLLRDIFGPRLFRPVALDGSWRAWRDGLVARMAESIYERRSFSELPVLADALQEAGCNDAEILGHLRSPGPHVLGCWPLDCLMGASTLQEPLQFVDLSGQALPTLPAELFDREDIGRLDLIHCGVEEIPEEIGNLKRLRTLYANWCRLTRLPESLGELRELEHLWLNNNRLTALPESVRKLTRLKALCLDNNGFDRVPSCILGLRKLKNLRMTDNHFTELPEEIGDLKWLENLSLGRNNLRSVPRGIGRLDNLTYLGLQGNPIQSLPKEVWELPNLVTLNLAHTGLRELPPQAARIPNLPR